MTSPHTDLCASPTPPVAGSMVPKVPSPADTAPADAAPAVGAATMVSNLPPLEEAPPGVPPTADFPLPRYCSMYGNCGTPDCGWRGDMCHNLK